MDLGKKLSTNTSLKFKLLFYAPGTHPSHCIYFAENEARLNLILNWCFTTLHNRCHLSVIFVGKDSEWNQFLLTISCAMNLLNDALEWQRVSLIRRTSTRSLCVALTGPWGYLLPPLWYEAVRSLGGHDIGLRFYGWPERSCIHSMAHTHTDYNQQITVRIIFIVYDQPHKFINLRGVGIRF